MSPPETRRDSGSLVGGPAAMCFYRGTGDLSLKPPTTVGFVSFWKSRWRASWRLGWFLLSRGLWRGRRRVVIPTALS